VLIHGITASVSFWTPDHRSVIYFEKIPDIDISPLLSKITVPVLALTGYVDSTVPPAQAHLIAEKVPHANLAVIEGGIGHMPFFEAYLDF
jgi:pimeloyl-ACP methyl ester carboxylesterase